MSGCLERWHSQRSCCTTSRIQSAFAVLYQLTPGLTGYGIQYPDMGVRRGQETNGGARGEVQIRAIRLESLNFCSKSIISSISQITVNAGLKKHSVIYL